MQGRCKKTNKQTRLRTLKTVHMCSAQQHLKSFSFFFYFSPFERSFAFAVLPIRSFTVLSGNFYISLNLVAIYG